MSETQLPPDSPKEPPINTPAGCAAMVFLAGVGSLIALGIKVSPAVIAEIEKCRQLLLEKLN